MFGPLDFLDELFSGAAEVLGWTWEKVITGIFTWFAKGVLLLMERVLGQIDTSTTPRLTDDWFSPTGLFVRSPSSGWPSR